MPDHATLSNSQRPFIHSSDDSLRDTEETPIVADLSASIGNVRKYLLGLQEPVQDGIEIASIELSKISAIRYSWQEAERFFLFISRLQLLEQLYTLRERDEIVQLLEKYPPLGSLLLEIHRHIVLYFPGTRFFLEAVTDPEAYDDLQQLTDDSASIVVSVVTRIRPREALDRLKQFYSDWWLNTPNRTKIKEKISFNLECV